MSLTDQFWNASFEEVRLGFSEREHDYICLLCGETVEKGIIYPVDGFLYDAGKYMSHHIEAAHGSVFEHLSQLDKRITGLSDHQNSLMRLFYQGMSDQDVQKELGIGSASTIRNHRFALKEKERQAKVFLVMMELMKGTGKKASHAASAPSASGNKREAELTTTPKEYAEIIQKYFPDGTLGPLNTFPRKHKHRLVVLEKIAERFDPAKVYSEKEVNAILEVIFEEDYVTIRRYLIDYSLLDRNPDGSQYWVKNNGEEPEKQMNRKQELKQMYKEAKTEAGVYQIRNTQNGKVWIDGTMNLKTMNGKQFMLKHGSHTSKDLQSEWDQYGEDAFVFEVLEVLEKKNEPYFDAADALEKLENKWLDKLQPYGDKGYNEMKKQ
ncbi:MAG: transcriptional regulator [Brevibacillus sp.]|nr:transcriptional regulator [Brevibacillus sp.]